MTDVITMARELGKALQKDERYLEMLSTNAAIDNNAQIQESIAKFTALRSDIDRALTKPEDERGDLAAMDVELRRLYEQIMQSPQMMAYNRAKGELESVLSFVNQIIAGSANGQDPDSIEQMAGGCSAGGCSSCSGCH